MLLVFLGWYLQWCQFQAQSVLDVLWGQGIKLIQVASNSELRENQWNNLLFFKIVPSYCFKIRVIIAVKCFLKIEIFRGHEVLKLYFKCSKNSISWNIKAPKYPFFNKKLTFLVQNFSILNFLSSQFLRLLWPWSNEREPFQRKEGCSIDFHAILN